MARAVRLVARRVVYEGRVIRLIREVLAIRGQRMVRETIEHPGSVVIVPVLDDGRVVLVKQYRRAVGRDLLELPAGTLDRRETRASCARRELEEETGWRARTLRRIGAFYAAPGVINERMTIFLAGGLRAGRAHPEPDEMIRTVVLPLGSALGKIASGAICDAKSIIGLLYLFLSRESRLCRLLPARRRSRPGR